MARILTPVRARALAIRLEAFVDFVPLSRGMINMNEFHYGPPSPVSGRLEKARLRTFLDDQLLLAALYAIAST